MQLKMKNKQQKNEDDRWGIIQALTQLLNFLLV